MTGVHLGDSSWKVNALELLHNDLHLLLALVPDLLDLALLNLSPVSPLSSLVLFEVVVELTKQVLVRALSENDLEFREAVLVRLLLTLAQEIEHFFPLHAEPSLQDLMQVLVKGFDLFDVGVFQSHCQVFVHVAQSAVQNFFNFVFVGFCSSARHLSKHLVLAALGKGVKLLLQICSVERNCFAPSALIDDQRLGFPRVTFHV